MKTRRQALAAVALAGLALGCRAATQVPEEGSLLLRVGMAAGAATPDELRLSAYDDTGTLWSSARFPDQGPLMPQSGSFLGTILIQPGTTVGTLRIDLRGFRGGVLGDEGILTITPAERASATFDLTLSTALQSDTDGDGVPDPIDDCPTIADPAQAGCGRDAGAADGPSVTPDAGNGQGGGGGAGGAGGAGGVPGTGGVPAAAGGGHGGTAGGGAGGSSNLPQGAACSAATQCTSGFCKDGACCNSACTDACNSCATGMCTPVLSGQDAPECETPMSCNRKGKCTSN